MVVMLVIGGMTSLAGAVSGTIVISAARRAAPPRREWVRPRARSSSRHSRACATSASHSLMLVILIFRPGGLTGGRELGLAVPGSRRFSSSLPCCGGLMTSPARARFSSSSLAAFAVGCGGSESSETATNEAGGEPIVIGTANSLTGILAPFELAINNGMDVAVDDINAAGGVDGRPIKIIHVDAKSDLNLSATAALDVIEKGATIVVPMCDADFGGPGARAANEKGILAITCAGAPGIGKQTIGPLTFNTYTRRTDGERDQRRVRLRDEGLAHGPTSSATSSSSTRRSSARPSRRAGRASAARSSARTRSCRPTSRSPRRSPGSRTDPARLRRARVVPGRLAGDQGDPRRLRRADHARRGVLRDVLAQVDAASVERLGRRRRLQLRRRPARRGERVLQEVRGEDRRGRARSTRIRSSATRSSRRSRKASRSPARPTARSSRRRSRPSRTRRCSPGPTTYTRELPRPRQPLAADHPLRGREAELDRRPRASRSRFRPIPAEVRRPVGLLDGARQLDA